MNIGKLVRLNRLFSHPSGRFCSIAVDHFFGYDIGLPEGLRRIRQTLSSIVAAKPDAVTAQIGVVKSLWGEHAGKVPLILQSTMTRLDDSGNELIATPEDAIRLGADAIAVVAFVRGSSEAAHLRLVADCVREASRYELPVILHTYPRKFEGGVRVSFEAEDIAWAVRCGVELGVDVIKAPYCGDVESFRQIVSDCPVPLVVAGGPNTGELITALRMMSDVIKTGARGATIGRNVWGHTQITVVVEAFKAVIHENLPPEEALKIVTG